MRMWGIWSFHVRNRSYGFGVPRPPKEPKIMAQYLQIETIGSIGSNILAILEVQVDRPDLWILAPVGKTNEQTSSETHTAKGRNVIDRNKSYYASRPVSATKQFRSPD